MKTRSFFTLPDYIQDRWMRKIKTNKEKANTTWKKFKRWLRWYFLQQDYCPQCNKETFWGAKASEPYHPRFEPEITPLIVHVEYYYCDECGLSPMKCKRIESVIKK